MTRILTLTALCALAASPTLAGGWETGKLETSFLYEDVNYVELSYGSLNYSVNGTTQAGVTHPMAKDQKRRAVSGKFEVGNLQVGITGFDSGAIQMDGQNSATFQSDTTHPYYGSTATQPLLKSVVPSADVNIGTQAIMGRYKFNENMSVIAGLRKVNIKSSTVTTIKTDYALSSASKNGAVYGFAYEMPEIAFRAEILRSQSMNIAVSGKAASGALSFGQSSVGVPDATTINVQTGIAANTLLLASAHKAKWNSSQIDVKIDGYTPANSSQTSEYLDVKSAFVDTTKYSLGLGRKLSDQTSASLSYTWENGGGATSTSPFTMSNGSKTLSLGVKHKVDAVTISAGLSYTEVGDVTVDAGNNYTATYKNNSVTAFGLKVGYNF